MSAVAERARVTILVSDFANVDAASKINVIGGTVAVLGFDPAQGLTTRISVVVVTWVPSDLLPADFSQEVTLMSNGEMVELPGAAGPQPLRIAQPVSLDRLNSAQFPVAGMREHIGANHVQVFDFNAGLPLVPGGLYEWHVRIDGDDEHVVSYPFAVAGPPPGPVIG